MKTSKFPTTFLYTFLGLILVVIASIYAILLSPIYLYRWIITKLVAPRYRPEIGKAVTVSGHFMATDFLSETNSSTDTGPASSPSPPRYIIVAKCFLQGYIPYEVFAECVRDGWLNKKEDESSKLKYPEFQQYIESWMGFMFWKQDKNFSLKNHLHVHRIPDGASKDSEKFLTNLHETLLNKGFPAKRSPWEFHLVQNYRNPQLLPNDGEITVVVLKVHHAMADGFAVKFTIIEGLANLKLSSTQTTAEPKKRSSRGIVLSDALKKLINVPGRFLYDAGHLIATQLRFRGDNLTPWHVPEGKRKGKTLYFASEFIPISKIKMIKNKFGVSFTSVILSSLGAGAAENFKRKGCAGMDTLPTLTLVPLPGHPRKLRNHAAVTLLDLITSPNMDSVTRLRKSEEKFLEARHSSLVPLIMWLNGRLNSSLVARLARLLCKNKFSPAIVSNFPGPDSQFEIAGGKALAIDTSAGLVSGVAGVAFLIISYNDRLRVAITAENAMIEKDELVDLVGVIEREINLLYELVANKDLM